MTQEMKEKSYQKNLQKIIQDEKLSILHFIYVKLLCADSAATFLNYLTTQGLGSLRDVNLMQLTRSSNSIQLRDYGKYSDGHLERS